MNKKIAQNYVQAVFIEGQLHRIAEFVDKDIIDHDGPPGLPPGIDGQRIKIEAFRAAFPDLIIQYELQVAEADMVAGRLRITGTHSGEFAGVSASGNKVDVLGHDMLRFRNGKITEHWVVLDMMSLMQQLQS